MKIALFGLGKMGQRITQLAHQMNFPIIACQSTRENASPAQLAQADVFIDFTHAESVLKHTKLAIEFNKPLVIGTTGWEDNYHEVKNLIDNSSIGCIHSANFSFGVVIFKSLIRHLALQTTLCREYDMVGIEAHHKTKVDSPSGTAKEIQEILLKHSHRSVPFSSVRCGSLPGTHEIILDSLFDTLTITHQAKNRDGFASGALYAAQWVIGKRGLFTMEDVCPLH